MISRLHSNRRFGAAIRLLDRVVQELKARSIVVTVLIVTCASACWAQGPFTLEQVMSFSFPSELVAASRSNRVGWVFNTKGVRNVWVADGPDFAHTARQITHFSADDGQPIASLRLTPDGNKAVFAGGSELNDAQESANPASWTNAPQAAGLRNRCRRKRRLAATAGRHELHG
jgi:hypothetical protein